MALDELSRHELHAKLREALGEQAAATLMEYLPPVGWADVATKRDLDTLEQRFDLRLEALEERIGLRMEALEERLGGRIESLRADFRGEIASAITTQTRTMILAAIGSNLTVATIAFAAGLLR